MECWIVFWSMWWCICEVFLLYLGVCYEWVVIDWCFLVDFVWGSFKRCFFMEVEIVLFSSVVY